MYFDKGQEFEGWVERQVNALKLKRINSKVFVRARDASASLGKFMSLADFRRKLKKLNSKLRFTFNEVVTGVHVMQNSVDPATGKKMMQQVHICAMPSPRRFTTIPMDEWYSPDVWYKTEASDLPEEFDPETGEVHLAKGWDTAPIGEIKEMQPMRGWGSVVKLLAAKGLFSMDRAKKMFPALRMT